MSTTKAAIAKPVFYNDWPKCDNGHRVNPDSPSCPKCGLAMTKPETDTTATMPVPEPGGTDEHTVRSERVSGTSTVVPGDGTSDRSSDRSDTDESLDDPVRPGAPATPAETPRPGQPALALDAAHKAGEFDSPLADATDEVLGPVTIPDTPEALIAPSATTNVEERLDRLPQHGFAGSLTLAHKRQLAKLVSHVTYRILDYIVTVIGSYGGRPQAIPADEIVAATRAAQSTVYRKVDELAELGYLTCYQAGKRTGAGGHKLKPNVYGLGHNLTTPYDDRAHGDRMTTKHTTVRAEATTPSDDRAHHKKVDRREIPLKESLSLDRDRERERASLRNQSEQALADEYQHPRPLRGGADSPEADNEQEPDNEQTAYGNQNDYSSFAANHNLHTDSERQPRPKRTKTGKRKWQPLNGQCLNDQNNPDCLGETKADKNGKFFPRCWPCQNLINKAKRQDSHSDAHEHKPRTPMPPRSSAPSGNTPRPNRLPTRRSGRRRGNTPRPSRHSDYKCHAHRICGNTVKAKDTYCEVCEVRMQCNNKREELRQRYDNIYRKLNETQRQALNRQKSRIMDHFKASDYAASLTACEQLGEMITDYWTVIGETEPKIRATYDDLF